MNGFVMLAPLALQSMSSYRGVEQGLARWAHNPKVGGSNPSPAIFILWRYSSVGRATES